jgi:hypothetical protein
VHDLLIPYSLLKAPSLLGVTLKTTEALYHTYHVVLTKEQLMIVNRGGLVTKKATSHLLVITLAKSPEHDHPYNSVCFSSIEKCS